MTAADTPCRHGGVLAVRRSRAGRTLQCWIKVKIILDKTKQKLVRILNCLMTLKKAWKCIRIKTQCIEWVAICLSSPLLVQIGRKSKCAPGYLHNAIIRNPLKAL